LTDDGGRIYNFAEQRKKRDLRKKRQEEYQKRKQEDRNRMNGASAFGRKSSRSSGIRSSVWRYVQFFLFLLVMAYMMRTCQGGGVL